MPAPSRRAKKLPARASVLHDPEAPPVVQAAQIAFKVMAAAKADTWDTATGRADLADLVGLTVEQQAILENRREILPVLVRRGATVTVIGCTGCDRYAYADGKTTVSRRCTLTLGCAGTPVKSSTTGYRPPKATDGAGDASDGAQGES